MAYVSGEVSNDTLKDYDTATFRIVLFDKGNHLIWTGSFKVRALGKKKMKPFEVPMEGIDFTVIPKIHKYEIYFESGY
ncbi:MAG: FxLYD domain-containing protein [Candidatus Omnitrophica bacterium]|nr:FxLYD domain-containing protein [Candidatus Omnitrophota bacterium]